MRILVVEDEKRLADALGQILSEQKYMVDVVNDGRDGYDYGRSGIYDCIILDIMLPYKNGFEVCSLLRKEKISTPILMLTARDSISDKVQGLDCGADDYMTKPFSTEELLARIRTLTRRKGEVILDELSYGDLAFSISSSELICKATSKSIRCSFKEAEVIKILMSNHGIIISKEELLTKIWGYDFFGDSRTVDVHIKRLREKIEDPSQIWQIKTVWGIGYKFEVRM